jgi:hypothetical protein
MRPVVLLFIFLLGCSTSKKYFTDTYRFKTANGQEYTVTQEYWDSMQMDEYVKEWMIRQKGVDPKTVVSFQLVERKQTREKK